MCFSICKQTRSGHLGKNFSTLFNKVRRRSTLAIIVTIGFAGIMLASCGSEKSQYRFKDAKEGIDYYQAFLKELKTAKDNDMAAITQDIKAWQEMEDSVEAVIMRDTASAKTPHFYPHERMRSLHNAVQEEFLNRAIAQPRTLQDVLTLKLGANRLSSDEKIGAAVKTAEPFFLSLDSVNIYNIDCVHLVNRYQSYLHKVEKTGIRSKAQLLSFMREEDRLFRSFVTHLSEMDGKSATDITKTTERIYAQLSRGSADSTLTQDDLFIYLTMRINRRMLVNAQGCLADIKASKVKTADQRHAYLWMIIQPFSSINDVGLALLTDTQKATFAKIAKEASPVLVRLAGNTKDEREHVAALPDLMIKIYLSTL